MLTRLKHLHRDDGSAVVIALMVMAIMVPLGLALLSIVDTQAQESGTERTRDRAFNLADSALHSAAVSLGRYAWPVSAAAAPSNAVAGTAYWCGNANASYGATLGDVPTAGSAPAKLQPNLNASFDDGAYAGATWQINVCDDDPTNPGPTVWKNALYTDSALNRQNYDANANQLVWVRAQASVGGRKRVLAALVRATQTPAFSSKFGLITGRLNAEVTNTAGALLTGPLLDSATSSLLGVDGLVAADSTAPAPASGVTALRCALLDGCLTGTLAGAAGLGLVDTLVTGGKLVQATSPTATTTASLAQLKQQAIATNTYVGTPIAGSASATDATAPPACTIPAGADSTKVVYIEQVGVGTPAGAVGGPGDQFCLLDVSSNVAYKALVIGRGRVVLRGSNVAAGGTFSGLVYAANQQRDLLGDAATPTREVVRIDRGAHVVGGVAADGKSAQVGVYPPQTPVCTLGLDYTACVLNLVLNTLGVLETYNPAITSNVALMNAVKVYDAASVVTGTYRDVSGERR